jgi:spermidine synthase
VDPPTESATIGLVNTTVPKPNPVITTVLLGVSTVVAQALLLREAMAAMGGSEMAWGLVMALWLAGMGAGSRLGVRLGTDRLAISLPVITLALAGTGVLLFRAAPAILGVAPGETLTTWHAAWLWALAVVPAAAAGGLAFPILAGALGQRGAGRAYTLEAMGALGGGLILTFVVIQLGTAGALLVAIGVVGGALTWPRRRAFALLIAVGCAALAVPAGELLARATWRWAGHPEDLSAWAETRHQRLETSSGPPFALYADGRLEASYPDPYTTAPRAHLMMLLHPRPQHVLATGCVADGSLEAMIRHPVEKLIVVEEDPRFHPLLGQWFGAGFSAALGQPPVEVRSTTTISRRTIPHPLDLVILADGDPTTLRGNRTRTVGFFKQCRSRMASDGVLVVDVGVNDTYLGGDAGRLLAILKQTLRQAFPQITALPGERVLLVAGGPDADMSTSADTLGRRLAERPSIVDAMPFEMLELLVDESRRPALSSFLEAAAAPINTADHPRAVTAAASLHESRSRSNLGRALADLEPRGPGILGWAMAAALAVLVVAAVPTDPRLRAMAAAWTVGFVSMGWWLLLLVSWQMTRGTVYAEIGALTGAFMAGVAGGGWAGSRARRPRRVVPWLLGTGAGLSLSIAAGLAWEMPAFTVPFLMAAGGVLTGAIFPGLGLMAGVDSPRRGAGLAFSADEIGAATAALIVGTASIPWVGTTSSAIGLALLGLAAVPAAARR